MIRQLDEVGLVYDVMLEIKDKETSAVRLRACLPSYNADAIAWNCSLLLC